jgi:hypothetical protein
MPNAPMPPHAARLRSSNRKTALALASVALAFFVGIIGAQFAGGPLASIGVVGTAVLVFLLVAIGRNLGGKR